jgi:Fur family ferric uptake transcriptional regulator
LHKLADQRVARIVADAATRARRNDDDSRAGRPAHPRAGLMAAREAAGDLHDTAEQRLRRADQRYTSGRRAIVGLLVDAGHPVSIGDIADGLPDLPRSSAYRHLVDLEAAGLVRRIAASDEFTRFELAEDLTEHHHHLVCVNCGQVTDVTLPPGFEQDLGTAIGQLADTAGFQPHSHRLDILGTCADCRPAGGAGPGGATPA